MRLVSRFERSSGMWARGEVTLGGQPGEPLWLTPGDHGGHVTLSSTAVNPQALAEFDASLTWSFDPAAGGELELVLDKPHEWSRPDEAPLRLWVTSGGALRCQYADGQPVTTDAAPTRPPDPLTLSLRKRGDSLHACLGERTLDARWPPDAAGGGFLTIRAHGTRAYLHSFELETALEVAPYTSEQRRSDIEAWQAARAAQNEIDLQAILDAAAHDPTWDHPTAMILSPGLVRAGEPVRVRCEYRVGEPLSPCVVIVEPDYLSAAPPAPLRLALPWTETGDGGFAAETELTPDRTGNWRLVWETDAGRLTRILAVIAGGYAVCTLWVGSNRPDIDQEIHRYELPGDYWVGDWWSPFGRAPQETLDYLRRYTALAHRYGDRLVPFANATWILPGIPNFNLMAVPAGVQTQALQQIQRLWQGLGLGPLELLASYTPGHITPRLAQQAGFKALTSLCTWQNWLDGADANSWKINHWAAPNAPYYVADDDFRKVAPGQALVMFSMGTASSVRNYSIFTMEGCPSLTCPMQRYTRGTAQSVNLTRFYDAVDGWLYDTEYQDEPVFFTAALENFVGSPDWAAANAAAVEYLVERALSHRLVFASAADVAGYYQRHYSVQPESLYYQPDIYCGYRAQAKPAQLPDRIEFSNARMHTLHVAGQALPQFFWDFTRPWQEPEWADEPELRDGDGLIQPERMDPAACTPRQVDLRDVQARVEFLIDGSEVEVLLAVQAGAPLDFLPLAVWDVPLAGGSAQPVGTADRLRWLSVVDGVTGNQHGLALWEGVPAGYSERRLRLHGVPRAPQRAEMQIAGGAVWCRTLTRDGVPYTYVWRADGVAAGRLEITLPVSHPAEARYNDGHRDTVSPEGRLSVALGEGWETEAPLLVPVSGEELARSACYVVSGAGDQGGAARS